MRFGVLPAIAKDAIPFTRSGVRRPMAELFHECGVAAVYHLPGGETSPLVPRGRRDLASRLMSQMLLDIQNRGQLASGMTSFDPDRNSLLRTHRDVGTVTEVFHLNHAEKHTALMDRLAGPAAIGHTRYATCGKDDRSYAQPFERHHIQKSKWFSFAFNGQLANYLSLRDEILAEDDFHLTRETDTEILMHLISKELSGDRRPTLPEMLEGLAERLDGAYNVVFLNASGDMFVARDPLGIRPLSFAVDGPLFAAASESVALSHLGFREADIRDLPPGHAIVVENGELSLVPFAKSTRTAHCFFEWIYFANVASHFDERSVYVVRKRLGEELASLEDVPIDPDTIVVPVPDTAKAAADAMAFQLNVPSVEGLIRNRYVGRTFIEGTNRADKVRMKYTPLREVLEGRKVLLVEDTIVRSTTMKALVSQLRERGGAREIHIRVACPPIVAPCFYGIDMSTVGELFAPKYVDGLEVSQETSQRMANDIGADSLRYLPVDSIARALDASPSQLCQACIDKQYPTAHGQRLYQIALGQAESDPEARTRTYDSTLVSTRT